MTRRAAARRSGRRAARAPAAALAALALLGVAAPAADAVTIREFAVPRLGTPQGLTAGPGRAVSFVYTGAFRGAVADENGVMTVTPSGRFTVRPVPALQGGPAEIALGPDGNFWVTDPFGTSIHRVTPAGQVTSFATPSGLSTQGITVGPDGALWFTQRNLGAIGRITTAGAMTIFDAPQPGTTPEDIVAGPDGLLWFTDGGRNALGRVTTAGAFAPEIPVPNGGLAGGGLLSLTVGPDGAVWFVEQSRRRVSRATTAGVVTQFPMPSPVQPNRIAPGPDGALYVTDNLRGTINRVTVEGNLSELGQSGSGRSLDIALGPDEAVWFGRTAGRVGRLDPLPPPEPGRSVNVEPVSGRVLVRERGSRRFVALGANGDQIPVGSQVDTRSGRVRLTSASGTGTAATETSDFFGGVFTVTQRRARTAFTDLRLSGPLENCPRAGTRGGDAFPAARRGRRLWGSGRGRHRLRGRRGSTTRRGTLWLVEDRCDGSTFFRVREGSVVVRDFGTGRDIVLNAGQTYVARPRG